MPSNKLILKEFIELIATGSDHSKNPYARIFVTYNREDRLEIEFYLTNLSRTEVRNLIDKLEAEIEKDSCSAEILWLRGFIAQIGVEFKTLNFSTLTQWCERGIRQGHALSMAIRAQIHIIQKEFQQAIELLNQAMDKKNAYAFCLRANIYFSGVWEKDITKAMSFYVNASEQGNSEAKSKLFEIFKLEKLPVENQIKYQDQAIKQGQYSAIGNRIALFQKIPTIPFDLEAVLIAVQRSRRLLIISDSVELAESYLEYFLNMISSQIKLPAGKGSLQIYQKTTVEHIAILYQCMMGLSLPLNAEEIPQKLLPLFPNNTNSLIECLLADNLLESQTKLNYISQLLAIYPDIQLDAKFCLDVGYKILRESSEVGSDLLIALRLLESAQNSEDLPEAMLLKADILFAAVINGEFEDQELPAICIEIDKSMREASKRWVSRENLAIIKERQTKLVNYQDNLQDFLVMVQEYIEKRAPELAKQSKGVWHNPILQDIKKLKALLYEFSLKQHHNFQECCETAERVYAILDGPSGKLFAIRRVAWPQELYTLPEERTKCQTKSRMKC